MYDFDHAVLFVDIDVATILGVRTLEGAIPEQRRRPVVQYSDKNGLERSDDLLEKRAFEESMHDVTGNVELDDWLVQQGKEDE